MQDGGTRPLKMAVVAIVRILCVEEAIVSISSDQVDRSDHGALLDVRQWAMSQCINIFATCGGRFAVFFSKFSIFSFFV